MKNNIRKIKNLICKMIDLDLETYEYDGKVVTKEELFDILDQEYIRTGFYPMAIYGPDENNILDVEQMDNRTCQVCIEIDSMDYPNTKPWVFNIALN